MSILFNNDLKLPKVSATKIRGMKAGEVRLFANGGKNANAPSCRAHTSASSALSSIGGEFFMKQVTLTTCRNGMACYAILIRCDKPADPLKRKGPKCRKKN